jgi:DNA-binding transcriptional LysR family regulator
MELRHLRYFVAVAEHENVTRAALSLHVSQPALSQQIRDLEEELGFPLLERSAKAVRLTAAGRVFLPEARAVLERASRAVETARSVANGLGAELHVGYAPSLTARILPPALRESRNRSPGLRVKLHDLSTEEMLAGLREGKLQLAFMVRPPAPMLRGLQFEELLRDPMKLAVAPGHPLARKRTVDIAEVAREPLIVYGRKDFPEYHELLENLFERLKTKPKIAEEHESVSSLIAAVEAGSGVALVSESILCVSGTRLQLLELSPAPAALSVGAAWTKKGLTETAEQFLALIKRNESV